MLKSDSNGLSSDSLSIVAAIAFINPFSTVSSTIALILSSTSNLSNQVFVFLVSGLENAALIKSYVVLAFPAPGIKPITVSRAT